MPARPGHRHSRREPPKTGLPAAPHSSDAAPRLFVHPSRADALSQRFARVPVACNVRFWARQGGVKSTKAAPPVSLPVRGCKRRSGANRSPGKRHAGERLHPAGQLAVDTKLGKRGRRSKPPFVVSQPPRVIVVLVRSLCLIRLCGLLWRLRRRLDQIDAQDFRSRQVVDLDVQPFIGQAL